MRRIRKLLRNLVLFAGFIYLLGLAGLYFGQEYFLFHPETLSQDHAFSFEGEFEEIWLDTPDGARINGLHFKAAQSKGAVLHLHGNGGSIQSSGNYHQTFTAQGLDFLAIDYRSFGKSTGERSVEGFIADAEAAYQYLLQHFPENQIRIYGQSLGTGIATPLAAAHAPHSLSLEAPYTSIADISASRFPIFPVRPLLRYPFECIESIQQVRCPVFVFHGTQDDVIPIEHGQTVAAAAAEATFFPLEGATHKRLLENPSLREPLFKHLLR